MASSPSFMFDAQTYFLSTRMLDAKERGSQFLAVCQAIEARDRVWLENNAPAWVGRIYWGCAGRSYIPRALRLAVYTRDGYACISCGSPERLTLDHAVPVVAGGLDTFDNLQAMCWDCNREKAAH